MLGAAALAHRARLLIVRSPVSNGAHVVSGAAKGKNFKTSTKRLFNVETKGTWIAHSDATSAEELLKTGRIETPRTLSSQLKALLLKRPLDVKAASQTMTQLLSQKESIDEGTVKTLWATLAKSAAFTTLEHLRSQLIRYHRYSSELYLHELELYKKHDKCYQARQLYLLRTRQMRDQPLSLQEMLCLLTMHIFAHHKHPKDPTQATKLFQSFLAADQRNTLGTEGFNAILQVWASSSHDSRCDEHLRLHFSQMDSSLSETPGKCVPDSKSYEWMVIGLKNIKDAEIFYTQALEAGMSTPSLHEKFLKRLMNEGEGEKAMELYAKLKQTPTNIDSTILTQILRLCTTAGDLAGTNGIFEDAKELGISPTANMFSLLIDLCATVKNSEMALNILIEELPRYGIEPNQGIYSSLIRLHCATGDLEKAESTLKEMRLRGFLVTPPNFGSLITAMLTASVEEGRPELETKAIIYWNDMKRSSLKPTVPLLATLLGLVQNSEFVESTLGAILTFTHGRNALSTLALEVINLPLAPADRILLVLHRLSQLQSFKMTSAIYNRLIRRLAATTRLKDVFALAFEFTDVSAAIMDKVQPPTTIFVATVTSDATVSLTFDAAQDFIQHVVQPNYLSQPRFNWYPDATDEEWDRNRTDNWRTELQRWKSEAKQSHLL